MSFLYLVLISISSFFVVRIGYKSVNSFQVSSLASSILFIVLYFLSYPTFSLLSLHFIFTGLCLIFLIISYYEILNLEKKIIDLKNGNIQSLPLPIEKMYKLNFKILGFGLFLLSMALVSGFFMQSVFTSNIIVKISFTLIAWLIYLITFIGIKFFNLTVKRSVRNLFISLLAVLIAYIANFYLVYN